MTLRTIPVRDLHGPECPSCAAVDLWLLNRKRRPASRPAASDLAGGLGTAASRDAEPPTETPEPSRPVSPSRPGAVAAAG